MPWSLQVKRLFDADNINTQYIHSAFCEEYEKNLIENVMQKKVMNGSVVPLLEKPKADKLTTQCQEKVDTFYQGDKLTDFERDTERMYITEKLEKKRKHEKQKSYRYKVRWTTSDLNRYQDQRNYRMNDGEYFGQTKP